MARDLYSAAWDFSALALGTVSGSNAAVFGGSLSGDLGFESGVYMHGGFTATAADGVGIDPFATEVAAQISGLVVGFDPLECEYGLSSASTFTVTWNGAQGAAMADLLGFDSASNLSGSNSYTSVKRPKYLIIARLAGQSQVHETYEPAGRIAYAESDNGQAYSTHPDELPVYRDWVQPFETLSGPTDAEYAVSQEVGGTAVRIANVGAATKVTWTWEHFFRHCRATLPFSLIDRVNATSGEGLLYKLRGEGAHFDPTRITADYDGHWTIPFVTRYLGEVAP